MLKPPSIRRHISFSDQVTVLNSITVNFGPIQFLSPTLAHFWFHESPRPKHYWDPSLSLLLAPPSHFCPNADIFFKMYPDHDIWTETLNASLNKRTKILHLAGCLFLLLLITCFFSVLLFFSGSSGRYSLKRLPCIKITVWLATSKL